jgi:ABC-type xylose transport system substrate-binding protein
MDNDEDLAIAIRNMTLAAERKSSRVAELEAQVEALTAEKNSLAQENADMADLIAELELKVNNDADVSLLGDEDDNGDNGEGGGRRRWRRRRWRR